MLKYVFYLLAFFFSVGAKAQFSQFMTEYKPATVDYPRTTYVPQYSSSYDLGAYSQYFTHYSAPSVPELLSKRVLNINAYDLLHERACKSQVIESAFSDGSLYYECTYVQEPNGQWVKLNRSLGSLSALCDRLKHDVNIDQNTIAFYTQLSSFAKYYLQCNGTMYVW